MKIVAMTLRYPPYTVGGYELLTEDAVEGLRARGHEVTVLCGMGKDFPGEDHRPRFSPGLDTDLELYDWDRSLPAAGRFANHFFKWTNYAVARNVLRRIRPDLVIYFNMGLVSLGPLLAARRSGVPSIGYVCDPWVENHLLREMADKPNKRGRRAVLGLVWKALRRLAAMPPIYTASDWLRDRLLADGWAPDEVTVLPTGLSPQMDALAQDAVPAERAPGAPLELICTSMLWGGKGQHVLVEAFGRAVAEGLDARLTLAGKEPQGEEYVKHLQWLASEAGVTDRVDFVGMLSPAELSERLSASHVFCLPSIWGEPFGLATIEAMAHGICTVVSDSGASPGLVADAGVVVETENVADLARVLLELGGDEPRRLALAHAARERALATFGREVFQIGRAHV